MKNINLSLIVLLLSTQLIGQTTILVPEDFATISEALNNAEEGTTVLVAPGTYLENITWPNDVLEIKLMSSGGRERTIIDGSLNEKRVLTIGDWSSDIGPNTIIDGFTFRNGKGGIEIQGASPYLKNLIIEDNVLDEGDRSHGGGVYLDSSESIIENCIIKNNIATSTGWAYGGGIYSSWSNPTIKSCLIQNNRTSGDGWSYGAGIYISNLDWDDEFSDVKILNCTLSENKAIGSRPYGSAIYIDRTNGVAITNGVITESISSGSFSESTIDLWRSEVEMINCTFVNNSHGIEVENSSLDIISSILLNNGGEEIVIDDIGQGESEVSVTYSLIGGGYTGTGNITGDPDFLNDDILVPSKNSICINNGDPNTSPIDDITGSPRPMPLGTRPDIGAYEVDQEAKTALIKFFDDQNENGIKDPDEFFVGVGAILLNGQESYVNTQPEGIYLSLINGENIIAWDQSNEDLWYLTTGPEEHIINVDSEDYFEAIDIGIRPFREYKNLTNAIYAPALLCNRSATLEVSLRNQGTTTESGFLWLDIDERMDGFTALQSPDIVNGNSIAWEFENLVPGESISRFVRINVPGVTQDNLDDEYFFLSEVTTPDEPDWLQEFLYKDIIRCAFDPNDKLVNPHREDNLSLIDADLTYTIRFQNVGNYHAEDVLVADTLDSNLDMSTFQLLGSSHRDKLHLSIEDHIVNFDFQDIYLPDSTANFDASNGYVMYSIRPDSMLAENTQIENTAHIYFDFNEAIITNTTKNIMVSEFPILDATREDELLNIAVFPNPSQSKFYFSEQLEEIIVFDLNGKQVKLGQDVRELDLENYLPGMYIAKLKQGEKRGIVKLILTK